MPKLLNRHASGSRARLAPRGGKAASAPSDPPPSQGQGAVRCFVDPDELRRLLSLMAGAELVGMLLARA